jgi:metal-responsive CopG/Arc/MetJ family transcriptional regulator
LTHGKPKKGTVTISTKIENDIQFELDKITVLLGHKTRSETIREAIYAYVDSFCRL